MKKTIIPVLMLVPLLIITYLIIMCNNNKSGNILYSWHMEALEDDNLVKIIKEKNVKIIYQDFSGKYLSNTNNEFIKKMNELKVDVLYLTGEKEYAKDEKLIIKEIDKVINYNKNNSYKIKGIVLDIEPYASEKEEENFDFDKYIEVIKKSYAYAKKNNLYYVLCIPHWFEKFGEDKLEEIIKNTDEVSIMNYSIKYTEKNIETEIRLAKQNNKNINTIYEINFGNEGYFKNYDEINKDYKKIQDRYNYKKLKIAYHHYDTMKDE